jgi:hypothetical protein
MDAANLGKSSSVEVLVVAGGGGSGMDMGGGGGGGGVIYNAAYSVETNIAIPITIGGGGAGAPNQYNSNPASGSQGTNTVFGKLTAIGGGGGGSGHREPPWGGAPGQPGGSGGGDAAYYSYYDSLNLGYDRTIFDTSQGQAGGRGAPGEGYQAGGGGGASQPGGGGGNTYAGNGGQGFLSAINGTSLYWGGGGGGCSYTQNGGNGGAGGGGGGSVNAGTAGTGGAGLNAGGNGVVAGSSPGGAGGTNTGGGGGGASHSSSTGANGGSGIVIVRYYGSQKATGGTITSSGGYTIHTFTSSGTFTPTEFIGAKDLSRINSSIAISGATWDASGGGNYAFGGTNFVSVTGLGSSTEITAQMFVKVASNPGGYKGFCGSNDGTNNDYQIGFNVDLSGGSSDAVNTINIEGAGVNGSNHMNTSIPFGQWFDLCAVISSTSSILYINGVQQQSKARTAGTIAHNFMTVGARPVTGTGSAASYASTSNIANYKFYNRALTQTDVIQNFNAQRSRFGI